MTITDPTDPDYDYEADASATDAEHVFDPATDTGRVLTGSFDQFLYVAPSDIERQVRWVQDAIDAGLAAWDQEWREWFIAVPVDVEMVTIGDTLD